MNIKSCACVQLYSSLVCELNPAERKIQFRVNWLIFLGIWGEAELILGICGARQNTFREMKKFFQGFGEINALFYGSTDPQIIDCKFVLVPCIGLKTLAMMQLWPNMGLFALSVYQSYFSQVG